MQSWRCCFLPRIKLATSDVNLPSPFSTAVKFLSIPAYTMTFNKSQGQTFDHVEFTLVSLSSSEPVLSRSRIPNHAKIHTKTSELQEKLLNNENNHTNAVSSRGFLTKK
ncbi:hypothetical protein AVEN_155936-1 [Araneus ventricosus]|uniref:(+)RNA virus helicase C-terminal domain-containing protein n=1 Tax=Araneus ventricosus TaxID=182803 RepID=A0A4Y2PTZ6_ARAVE|nr:hypothetical protein AVEN_155936-1 [Araneus ventricosus]